MFKLLPYPFNKDFALTFVDDTDFSTRRNTQPVYDFLKDLNVFGTKTVWPHNAKRPSYFRLNTSYVKYGTINNGSTLKDKDYLDFILGLQKKGFEIALHNASAGNSLRNEIIKALKDFKDFFGMYPKINTFHERNIENLYSGRHKLNIFLFKLIERIKDASDYQGHIINSPFFWGDIAKKKITYIRLPFHNLQKINTLGFNPSMPFHDPNRPYVNFWFSSSDGSNCKRFVQLLSKNNISKLHAENGACIIYTHFAKGFTREKKNKLVLNQDFLSTIKHISMNYNAWFPTASELLDRLKLFKNISINYNHNSLSITNSNKTSFKNLSVRLPKRIQLYDINSPVFNNSNEQKYIHFDIPACTTFVFRTDRYSPLLKLIDKNHNIKILERNQIELLNYLGLLKQKILKQ